MSSIRVTYSGLISLVVSIIGAIAGTFFVIFVTRKLGPEDFGLWTLIGSLVGYVAIIEPIIDTWSSRQIARGEQVGKTIVFTIGVFSVAGFTVYSVIVFFIALSLHASFTILLLSAALIPLNYFTNSLSAISIGFRPQIVSYGLVAFECSKVPLGLFFVVFRHQGIEGALLTVIVASSVKLVILAYLSREKISGIIDVKVIKFWFRTSWLTLYTSSAGLLRSIDTLIFSLLTNSLTGLAFYGAALMIGSNIGQFGSISQALYPKLLATGKKEYAEQNLRITVFFTLPFLGASIIFAKPILYVLNPLYATASTILIVLSIRSFAVILMDIFFNILRAYETVDIDKQASFSRFVKSKLFFIPTLNYIMYGLYIIMLVIFLVLFRTSSDISLVTGWSLIFLGVTVPFTIYGMMIVRKEHAISFPTISFIKYSFSTLVASMILYMISENAFVHTMTIWDILPKLLIYLLIGCAIYFGVAYAVDKQARTLIRSIIDGFTKK